MGRYDQPEPKSKTLIVVVIITVVIASLLVWLYSSRTEMGQDAVVEKLTIPQAEQIETENRPTAAKEFEMASGISPDIGENKQEKRERQTDFPFLLESDDWVRQEIGRLSPDFSGLLTGSQLLKKYLQIVNDFSQGQRISKHMRFLRLQQPFLVEADGQESWFIAQRSYQRYDRLVRAFAAIDVSLAIRVYQKLQPLMEQVFREFGYPDTYHLEDIFQKAAAEIIAAPIIVGRIAVVRPSVDYKFVDKKLEALNPVHKQMLRMGPENTRMIQEKLRELVQKLVQLNKD